MPRTLRAALTASILLGACLASVEARANGRFPGATQLVLRGKSGAITTSFGVITTADDFASTHWVCETALGYEPQQNNELGAAVFPNGAIGITGAFGLTVSSDFGCTNPKPAGPVGEYWMADISVDEKDPTSGIAMSRGPNGSTCAAELFETKDQGATWSPIGTKLPNGFCALTIDSAPSDSQRIFVSGNIDRALDDGSLRQIGQLLVSDDRGKTWTAHDVPDENLPFIGALDPIDRDTVWVRTLKGVDSGDLLVSRDAGKTFTKIATLTGKPLQFYGPTGLAVSPDGTKVAYGSLNEGLFVIEGKDGVPQKRGDFPVMCLTWNADGLYACSTPSYCGPFFIGRSNDDGKTFTPILPTLDVHGDQTTCAPSTLVAKDCPQQWATFKQRMRACGEPEDAGGGAPRDASSDVGGEPPLAPPPNIDCDCDTVATSAARPYALPLVGLVAILALARRKRRPRA